MEEWRHIGNQFFRQTGFAYCLGAIDGKHVRIIKPAHAGSQFHNYKGFESVILQAAADSNYEFIFAECGSGGRAHDMSALMETEFYKDLIDGRIRIPPPELVAGYPHALPYSFVGDEAYALRSDFVQPYPQRNISPDKVVYNMLHCKARRFIECSFGIMVNQFRIFQTAIANLDLEVINIMVIAICVLHNILRRHSPVYRANSRPEDVPVEVDHFENAIPPRNGRETREMYNLYAQYRINQMNRGA